MSSFQQQRTGVLFGLTEWYENDQEGELPFSATFDPRADNVDDSVAKEWRPWAYTAEVIKEDHPLHPGVIRKRFAEDPGPQITMEDINQDRTEGFPEELIATITKAVESFAATGRATPQQITNALIKKFPMSLRHMARSATMMDRELPQVVSDIEKVLVAEAQRAGERAEEATENTPPQRRGKRGAKRPGASASSTGN